MQTDYLLPGLTVKEALMYPALFRLPSSMTTQQKMDIVCYSDPYAKSEGGKGD